MHSSHQTTHRVLLRVGVEHLRLLPVVQGVVNQRGQHHVVIEVRSVRVSVKIDRFSQLSEPEFIPSEPGRQRLNRTKLY